MTTTVYCEMETCEYIRMQENGIMICQRPSIELDQDGTCETYDQHSLISPEYQKVFLKRIVSRADRRECKLPARGKRYEFHGLVWFTDQDDRYGIDELKFTEQRSGLLARGRDIRNPEVIDRIRARIQEIEPVEALPEATQDDKW